MPLTETTTTAPTTAERRALRQIQTSGGRFAVIAADHGQPLVDMLDGLGLPSGPEAQREFKSDLVDTVGRDASAILLDPDMSLPHVVDADVLPRDVGLIARIEADGHEEEDGLRRSGLIPDLGAAGARALGATAAKVMVFLRADREDLDGYTAGMVRAALEDCAPLRPPVRDGADDLPRSTTRAPRSSPRARRTSSSTAPCSCRSAARRCSSSSTRAARRGAGA